ncbi:antitoxin Xre/MbcA/ParS toxin-binding domain-containing protein [Undibacterium sp.]|uniref:type II RES/Xre toxin-antitoxin system antitoxin n=1 Tax=Undibacterium sp. TaxID=1914977 RepID=UPI0025E4C4B1|nr:antitoxin Xre/MbcA/ParS toxin-binding domain-containing protein [Undibacterium sp.]
MTNATSAKKLPSNSPAAITIEPKSKLRSDTHSKMKNRIANRAFAGDTSEMIRDMRKGTPASVIPELANRFGMSQDGLFAILRLPRSIMKSRISKNKVLSPPEQDRLYRADRVWSRAVEVLEDENSARFWINRVNRTLGGEAPLSLLDTEVGYELVLDTLGQIENGVIS